MGRKEFATKINPPSTRHERTPEPQQLREEPPPNPQPSEQAPPAPPMVSLDTMAEFLRLQDPTRNWATELANFNLARGQGRVTGANPTVAISVTSAQPTSPLPSTILISSTIPQGENPLVEATTSEPAESSPTHQEMEPMEVEAIAAYYDSDPEERSERLRKEKQDREGGGIVEETPVVEPVRQEIVREEIDLNESARKRNLMTDTEFEAIVEEVTRREEGTASMPEGQVSQSIGETEGVQDEVRETEPVDFQPEAGDDEMQVEEERPATEIQESEPVAPPVIKPKAVKRKLVLKGEPKARQPKPQSQRCLGKWAASKRILP
ncbi:cyclic nucleotide-gated cation channel beta-1-like [Salvia splendens]|uniref:cyclic nucleotide-gated cation channel beta-1-like n=1 Tax=Salvia splendens TaxID=180675 RepID=UPI001C255CF6|nr:cyclic nucleotide-gated cation channel beta-1-like [Salvia splendens]